MKRLIILGALVYSSVSWAQNQPLFTIGDEPVTAQEFKAIYLKNRDIGKDIDPKTPSEYLDLYINFKLKVREARALGMDTMPAFVREFNNYRKQLAQPYLEDRSVDSILLQEAYQRLSYEVHAAHIMVDLLPDVLPEDTLEAYNKLLNIKAQAEKGTPFDVLARKFSTDPGSASNGGDLGYFTVFNMVYPFENAAYNTPVGEISKPVRSQFGYHIVKVIDKRPNRGTVQVKHIFLISNDKTDAEKAAAAEARASEIYTRLKAGESFDQLARQFSEDKNTAEQGGLLQPFGINTMMTAFEDASFNLENPGDYSEPFKTSIGWHIVQLVEKKPLASFEDVKPELEQKISRDSRAAKSREVFITNLKRAYNFTEYEKRLGEIYKVVDESLLSATWEPSRAAKLNRTLFTLDGIDYNQQDFVNYLATEQKRGLKSQTPQQEVYKKYSAFVNKTVLDYENKRLEEKYPDFKLLVQEYHDGILLFDLTQQKVWNKASQDSIGLNEFYEANKTNYMWPERAQAFIYSCETEKIAKKVLKLAQKGEQSEKIVALFNEDSQLNVISQNGYFTKGQNKALDAVQWQQGAAKIVEVDGRYLVVHITEIRMPEAKELQEARGMVISDYQKKLEADWIEELKSRFPVAINQEVFRSLEVELK